ncbi:MAG: ATP-binding protein [Halobacteriaceae archaeon]
MLSLPGGWLHGAYVLGFALAALTCLAGVPLTRRFDDREVRRYLAWLLLTSGGWAAAQTVVLLAPSAGIGRLAYLAGLVVGLATVGPWLALCSAVTNRSLHRSPPLRRLAVTVFLAITLIKVTNPIHGLYYGTTVAAAPFVHLSVELHLLHWVTMGLAYALATVGYFMLLELFWTVGKQTRGLAALVVVTGLPVGLDVAAVAIPALLELNYEPLGVAVFAVGVLVVFREELHTVRHTGGHDEPVVVLADDGRIRDFNRRAADLLPDLETGVRLAAVAPVVAAALEGDRDAESRPGPDRDAGSGGTGGADAGVGGAGREDGDVVTLQCSGRDRSFRVEDAPLGTSGTSGRVLTLTDVTEREEYRRALERQNQRLERFASVVSHDLRNPLNVAAGRVELLREERDSEDENLVAVATALDRMEALVEDLLAIAREGRPVTGTTPCSLGSVAERAWAVVETGDAGLTVDADATVDADPDRLQQLLENLFRNAVEHGGPDVTVGVGPLPETEGFYVEDDGPGIPAERREDVFESGYTTEDGGTGLGLSIVREVAEAHGWGIGLTESADGGARFEFPTTGGETADAGRARPGDGADDDR